MCFDPTDVGTAYWLLLSCVLSKGSLQGKEAPKPPAVIDVSNFPLDGNTVTARIDLVARFKVRRRAD